MVFYKSREGIYMDFIQGNSKISMTLDEFYELLDKEDRIEEMIELLYEVDAELEDELDLDLGLHPFDAIGNVGVMERPSTTINQFFFNQPGQSSLDYLDALEKDENDPLAVVRRILQRFGSFQQ